MNLMSYSESTESPLVLPFAHPLDEFYAHAGLNLPPIDAIPAEEMPQPYQQLLVHDGDMTPTLEKFHRSTIHLDVLRREQRGDFYFREVALVTDARREKVEFGAIKIYLALFPRSARNEILAETLPLGTILAKHKVTHTSRPKAFLRVRSDDFINGVFALRGTHTLYGRRNTLSNLEGHSLAEIVEILPPAKSPN
jgi:chorismate-pyruvate lyase